MSYSPRNQSGRKKVYRKQRKFFSQWINTDLFKINIYLMNIGETELSQERIKCGIYSIIYKIITPCAAHIFYLLTYIHYWAIDNCWHCNTNTAFSFYFMPSYFPYHSLISLQKCTRPLYFLSLMSLIFFLNIKCKVV